MNFVNNLIQINELILVILEYTKRIKYANIFYGSEYQGSGVEVEWRAV